jgi:hypothetical protein
MLCLAAGYAGAALLDSVGVALGLKVWGVCVVTSLLVVLILLEKERL